MKLEGRIHEIFETDQVSDRFKKKEFVVEYAENPMYPQYILFQLIQDNVNKIDPFGKGDRVSVAFNLKGRAWTSPAGETKYFNAIEAWKIELIKSEENAPTPEQMDVSSMDGNDDLPF